LETGYAEEILAESAESGTMTAVARMSVLALLALPGCVSRSEPPTVPGSGAAHAWADVDWSQAEQIDVTLTEFSFSPSRIVLEHGHPYRLHLEDHGSGGHNFDAPDFFRTAVLRDDAVAGEARQGAVELARGEVKDLYLVPGQAGTYPLECSHLLHAAIFGMTGEIEVR
jgi:uncharacterized cupredoxin-like copper-binding protein